MIIREYRILLPLTVSEYQIAQLYMLIKKSQTESKGEGNGVEILKNEPYYDETIGIQGQYTLKILHVGSHMPKWFRDISPEDAFKLSEESWNAYPFVKTIMTSAIAGDRFRLEVSSKFVQDKGEQENIFNLKPSELRNRQIVNIDFVNDVSAEPKPGEDPKKFISEKTHRGPLGHKWISETNLPIMCCYKLFKVEFKYWGLQTRVERLIHDLGVHRTLITSHQQAWCWQDEWVDLNLDDIRRLERETAEFLKKQFQDENVNSTDNKLIPLKDDATNSEVSPSVAKENSDYFHSLPPDSNEPKSMKHTSLKHTRLASFLIESDDDNDDEFYDALTEDEISLPLFKDDHYDHSEDSNSGFLAVDSVHVMHSTSYDCLETADGESLPNTPIDDVPVVTGLNSPLQSPLEECSSVHSLLLIVHGGSYLEASGDISSKVSDFIIFQTKLKEVHRMHFLKSHSKINSRLVACPLICTRSLACLSMLKSVNTLTSTSLSLKLTFSEPDKIKDTSEIENRLSNFAFGAIPFLIRSDARYTEHLAKVAKLLNVTYEQFAINNNFTGQVSIVADCIGSLLVFDILTNFSQSLPPLKFHTEQFYMLGSPIGIILSQEKLLNGTISLRPNCSHIFNIYYDGDPLAFRIEPLIDLSTRVLLPVTIPYYKKRSLGTNSSIFLKDYIEEDIRMREIYRSATLLDYIANEDSIADSIEALDKITVPVLSEFTDKWWSNTRIDFIVETPFISELHSMPTSFSSRLIYSRYWEATEIFSFILTTCLSNVQQTHEIKPHITLGLSGVTVDDQSQKPRSESITKHVSKTKTLFISKGMPTNFRGFDVVVREGYQQEIKGKFAYGKLDFSKLSKEIVEMYCLSPHDGWTLIGRSKTNTHGFLSHTLESDKILPVGIHPIEMFISDTSIPTTCYLAVLPSQILVDAVVFSIDGSFYSDFSVQGNKSKCRPGSVEIVRFWKNLGYLVFYVTGRPDMQKNDVTHWLDSKNFPFGLTYFADGFSKDAQAYKTNYLRNLIQQLGVNFRAAYGSSKEYQVYKNSGIPLNCIYPACKASKHPLGIGEDYFSHIETLKSNPPAFARTAIVLTAQI